jgi:hypothetical protein
MSTDVAEVCAASIIRVMRAIALMMEAVHTSETSVDIQLRTWQYIPEDSELLTDILYGCETWSITLRGRCRLRMFENRLLWRIFGCRA